jgi:cytochrome c
VADKADFGSINNNIAVEFKGSLQVESDRNADFRLVSDDGSYLYINDRLIIDNGGYHGLEAKDGEVILKAGKNNIRVVYFNGAAEGAVSLQWAPHGAAEYEIVPAQLLTHDGRQIDQAVPHVPRRFLVRNIPGDQSKLQGVHPSFDLAQARPANFSGRIGGMDFMSDGSLLVSTWDSLGPVYKLEGVQGDDPESIKVTRIATGLAEPLGLKVVDDEIYVLQKQELTKLVDHDGDGIADEYLTVCDDWQVSANFHEFAFGLEYKDGYFYATLATAIMPGGASANPQIPDRGKALRISRETGEMEFVAHGLRTPNGIGTGIDDQLFIADNQGDWLPSSKIVHLQQDAWYGSRSVDFEGTAGLTEKLPVVWLPQDEIGNSPSMPLEINVGPYMGQMIHGEVTHGGIKRVFIESVNNQYQGAVFRFTQGLEAGVNRLVWGPDGSLYVGEVGSSGNWSDGEDRWYGLQRLTYNNKTTFEILAVRARSDGLELEFTAPIEAGSGHQPEEYRIQQWYYLPTENYGGPKLDLEDLQIKSINISENRKKVFLELPGIKEEHVIHVRIYQPFRSADQQSLWTTEAWYNMNLIPADNPGFRSPAMEIKHNTLSSKESEEGWELLFDGKTTDGWRNFQSDRIGAAWKVTDGTLMLDNSNKVDGQLIGGGDLVTEEQYQDYELVLEWKIEQGGNSGIIFNVLEEDYERPYHTGPEVQILDNVRHRDGRIETHRSGDLYDMIASKFVTANGPNEWNKVRIISKDGKVSHWQNGYEVVSYEMHTPEWDQMVAESKFKDMPGFGKSKKGHIALQDHGDRVWFRNIKIRQL